MSDPPSRCGACGASPVASCRCPVALLRRSDAALDRLRADKQKLDRLIVRAARKPHKRRGTGGKAFAAAALLSEHFGTTVLPTDLSIVAGFWNKVDVYRFQVGVPLPGHDNGAWYGCWQTLTQFVRLGKKYGLTRNDDDKEIWANEK